jgi:hypothetical protein
VGRKEGKRREGKSREKCGESPKKFQRETITHKGM